MIGTHNMLTLAAGGAPGGALVDLLVVLACAAGVTMMLGRLRVSAVPGYLIAGVLIGPGAFGLVSGDASIEMIADLALLFLMFQIGLHLDVAALRGSARALLIVGFGTTAASALLGWPIAMAFGLSAPAAATVAMAMSLSSTAVVLKLLAQRRELQSVYGRVCFGILLVQDLMVFVFLAAMPALAAWAGVGAESAEASAPIGERIGGGLLRLAGVIAVLLIGRRLLPRLMHEAARAATPEILLVLAAAVALAAGLGSASVGLSPEMGAFFAGFILASTAVKHQLHAQLSPVRDLLMAVFFTAVGLNVDVLDAASMWWIVLLAVAATIVLKAVVIGLGAWFVGVRGGVSLLSGLSLAQAGEFSLVVLGAGAAAGLIGAQTESAVISAVIIGLIVTPTLMAIGRWGAMSWASQWGVSPWARRSALGSDSAPPPADDPRPGVIVVGFGPIGRAVADRVEKRGARVTVLELNPTTVRRQRELGRSVVFGDASNGDVLEAAGLRSASAMVVTIPDEAAMLRAVRAARQMRGDICLAVRTSVMSRAMLAIEAGASHVTVEEVATAEAMASAVFKLMEGRATPPPVEASVETAPETAPEATPAPTDQPDAAPTPVSEDREAS